MQVLQTPARQLNAGCRPCDSANSSRVSADPSQTTVFPDLRNVTCGGHLVEADLIPALDGGHLAGATLDVFDDEPLPADHPFWRHPKITVTPHVASISDPRSVADLIADSIRRVEAGEPPLNVVDPAAGY